MKGLLLALLIAAVVGGNVGDPAPAIKVAGTDAKQHSLRDYVGKSWLIVAWYPKAMTPG